MASEQSADEGVCCPQCEGPLWRVDGVLRCGECWSPPQMDDRERHIRALASLMTRRGYPTPEVEIYLRNREYGLALAVLAEDVNHG